MHEGTQQRVEQHSNQKTSGPSKMQSHPTWRHCVHCNHTWRFYEIQNVGRKYCSPVCQVLFVALGDKLEQRFNDVMVVRRPTVYPIYDREANKKLDEKEKDENNNLKATLLNHWRAIFVEFVDFFDEFQANELVRYGARFDDAPSDRAILQTKAQMGRRRPRHYQGGLEQYLDVEDALHKREKQQEVLDKLLYNRSNDKASKEDQEAIEKALGVLNNLSQGLDYYLESTLQPKDQLYEYRRDERMLALQYGVYMRDLGKKDYLATWTALARKAHEARRASRVALNTAERVRLNQLLKNRLFVAYRFQVDHEKLKKLFKYEPETLQKFEALYVQALAAADALQGVENDGQLMDTLKAVDQRVQALLVEQRKAVSRRKEEGSLKSKKKKDKKKDKIGQERPPKKASKHGKSKTKKHAKSDDSAMAVEPTRKRSKSKSKGTESEEDMATEPTTTASSTTGTQAIYTESELSDRVQAAERWSQQKQTPARQQIIMNMYAYYQNGGR